MFSNKLIKKIAVSSNEKKLMLSEKDWHIVLSANKAFREDTMSWKGNKLWGKYLLNKIGKHSELISFRNSLELCCGNGYLFFSFKDLFKPVEDCYYIDLSEEQKKAFIIRCESSGAKLPNIINGDIGNLQFDSDSLQMVYGNSFLHHLPDVGRYLREVCRVLVPGGKFIGFHEPTATAPYLESFPRSVIRDIDDESLTDIWLITPETIKTLLKSSGFRAVDVYPNGLLASILVTPWQLVLAKIGLPYQSNLIPRIKILCDNLERFLPLKLRLKYSPSIAIVATK